DIVNDGNTAGANTWHSNWQTKGYNWATGATFKGYTVGPGYWGKTFFIWPPDPITTAVTAYTPSGTNDWRQNFFKTSDGSARLKDNTQLFQNGANFNSNNGIGYQDPAGNYEIDYKA